MNSEPRLPDHPLGDSPAGAADGVGGDGRDLPSPKGFFGRFFGALTGNDDGGEEQAARNGNQSDAPSILNLRRMRVDDVAVPKAELVAAPDTVSLEELVGMFREHGFSRVPVYEGSLDSPLGMIHLKDLALKHGFGHESDFDLRPMLRPLLYVPPSMSIGVLLQQMQQKRIHMALVIDEYGGVDGLVTIEDLIEQVIGEIEDEHDEGHDVLWVQEKPGQWLIRARAPLDEVESETGLRLFDAEEEEDIDTIGGLVIRLSGRVPDSGETLVLPNGHEVEIVDADARRIKRLRVRLKPDHFASGNGNGSAEAAE